MISQGFSDDEIDYALEAISKPIFTSVTYLEYDIQNSEFAVLKSLVMKLKLNPAVCTR